VNLSKGFVAHRAGVLQQKCDVQQLAIEAATTNDSCAGLCCTSHFSKKSFHGMFKFGRGLGYVSVFVKSIGETCCRDMQSLRI
jgi:hypothetical protein